MPRKTEPTGLEGMAFGEAMERITGMHKDDAELVNLKTNKLLERPKKKRGTKA